MKFNATKCNVMRVCRSQSPFTQFYSLEGQVLSQVNQAKYLGVTLSDELNWSPHIAKTVSKASPLRLRLRGYEMGHLAIISRELHSGALCGSVRFKISIKDDKKG